jgi:hypothetical protein
MFNFFFSFAKEQNFVKENKEFLGIFSNFKTQNFQKKLIIQQTCVLQMAIQLEHHTIQKFGCEHFLYL